MDEASVFHKVVFVKETWDGSNPGNVSGADMIRGFQQTWLDHYHKPNVLRVDAEGALSSSEEFLAFCDSLSIRVEPIAGEAPW